MEFTTLAAMLTTQARDGQVVTVRDTRQSYIYLKNRDDLVVDNVNVFAAPVSSDRWVAEKAVPTWDESAIVSALGYTPEDAAQKGEPNGYPELDASSRIPLAQLPTSVQTLKGSWNASTNTPTLADGAGTSGDTYRVSVAATRNLGSGNLAFGVDDRVVYNGTTWEKWDANDAVQSVFGRTGAVTAQAGDYSAFYAKILDICTRWDTYAGYGSTNNKVPYFTNKNTDTSTGEYTIVNNATNGLEITINTAGVYAITFCANSQTGSGNVIYAGVSLNSAQLTTSIEAITAANRLAIGASGVNAFANCTVILPLAVNDVIRPHTNGETMTVVGAAASFSITKIS